MDLQARARELAQGEIAARAAEVDRSEAYPWDNVALLKDAGFFGMTIPQALGGQGLNYLDAVLVVEELAKACAFLASDEVNEVFLVLRRAERAGRWR